MLWVCYYPLAPRNRPVQCFHGLETWLPELAPEPTSWIGACTAEVATSDGASAGGLQQPEEQVMMENRFGSDLLQKNVRLSKIMVC